MIGRDIREPHAKASAAVGAMRYGWIARDGMRFELRPIEANDYSLLLAFARHLSYKTRYFRYGRGTFELDEDELRRICSPDPQHSVHSIVLCRARAGQQALVGSGRLVYGPGTQCSELTLTVSDSWQRRGVGRRLLESLIQVARGRGDTEIIARTLATNAPMLGLVRQRGFSVTDSEEGPAVKIARLTP